MKARRHVILNHGEGEHAACGYAFDAFDTEGDEEANGLYELARPGLTVTCPECCEAVRNLRASLKGLRLRPML